jgi:DNA polymerase delta subunit 2
VGNQPKFESTVIEGVAGQVVLLVAVPIFAQTGEVVLLDTETLNVEVFRIEVFNEG